MSDSMSPCSIWSTGSESFKKTAFPFMDESEFVSDGGLSPRSKYCKFCNDSLFKISPNWLSNDARQKSSHESTSGCQSKLFSISENIFGLFCSETVDHSIQLQNIHSAISQVKKNKIKRKFKIFCLSKICPAITRFCVENITIAIDLFKLPHLTPILKFCENVFDWLSENKGNIAFFYCNTDELLILTMCYAYSCYYDSLSRRDIQQSIAIKTFLNLHSKAFEKVPVSYRRYAGYMSLNSSLKPLQNLRSSVNLYCLILYNFPAMESNKYKNSQLFFKIYTNNSLKCSHTTKLYCLPSNVHRLVILFDQYPILLSNDCMIICYHRSLVGSRRTKILRINFHTCQATGDMLTFYSQDFEDLYPACPFKIKLDLYFRATAVFGQGKTDKFRCDTSLSHLSELERYDSYSSLPVTQPRRAHSSLSSTPNTNIVSSITIFKTHVPDHSIEVKKEETKQKEQKTDVISNTGRITIPVDSHHSTKLESVRTSSTILNGPDSNLHNLNQRHIFSPMNDNYGCNRNIEGEKCSKQLDTLMRDLNLGTHDSPAPTISSYSYSKNGTMQANIPPSTSNHREIQLMSELLEAQKEISNLRRSMNHLDMIDHVRGTNHAFKSNVFTSRSHGNQKDKLDRSTPESYSVDQFRSRMWTPNQKDHSVSSSQNDFPPPSNNQNLQQSYHKQEFNSLDGRSTYGGYSAHRENLEKERTMKEKYITLEKVVNQTHQHDSEIADVLEEIETINLQPIGKGIQDLNKGNSHTKFSRSRTPSGLYRGDHGSHAFVDNIGSLSPTPMRQNFSMSKSNFGSANRIQNDVFSPGPASPIGFLNGNQQHVTLQSVEDKVQYWYQPNITRDEAIVILKNCSPGSFLIRDSNTYSGAYGLAVKVATIPPKILLKSDDMEAEKVRHYLIEPLDNQGVCFKGFPEEPVFPSLTNLVLYYTHTISVLPCLLVLPDRSLHEIPKQNMKVTSENSVIISSPKLQSQFTSNKNGYSVYYLGCFDVEYITGPSVINKGIERLLADLDARKFTECQLRINPGDGIVLTDMERKLFFRRHHSFANISYCALDPRERKIELDLCKSNGVRKTKLFGIIVKNYVAGESKCFLFGELDPAQKANDIVKAIAVNLPRPMQI